VNELERVVVKGKSGERAFGLLRVDLAYEPFNRADSQVLRRFRMTVCNFKFSNALALRASSWGIVSRSSNSHTIRQALKLPHLYGVIEIPLTVPGMLELPRQCTVDLSYSKTTGWQSSASSQDLHEVRVH